MLALKLVALAYSLFYVCNAGYVDTLPKCSYKDGECMLSSYGKLIKDGEKNGLPEFGIPPLDPLEVKNISLSLMDGVTLTFVEGVIKGISKGCVYSNMKIDLDKKKIFQEFLCNMTIKGQVKVTGSNPAIQSLIGTSNVDSQAKAKLKLGNVNDKYEMPFKLERKDDGEIYMKMENKGVKHVYDLESASLIVEKVFIANNDISQLIMTYFTENWRTLLKSYGKIILNLATGIYVDIANKYNLAVPLGKTIIEDLSSYVDN